MDVAYPRIYFGFLLMALTPESKVKRGVRKVLDELKAYYVMPVTNGYGKQGAPDFLVCYNGKFFGIETKAGRGQVTALQDKNLKEIQQAGGIALVVREDYVQRLKQQMENCNETNTRESTDSENAIGKPKGYNGRIILNN